jgi:uncharacterized protein with NRDE domain
LVSDYLTNGDEPQNYLEQVSKTASAYNGFNLIVGKLDELYYLSNYKNGIEKIPSGIHGLSNHLLNTPWPKVEQGIKDMKRALTKDELNVPSLFDILRNETIAPDEKLPNTGVGLQRERMLSSMFIKSPNYGTSCSTEVLINQRNEASYTERVYDLTTFDYTTRSFQFQI